MGPRKEIGCPTPRGIKVRVKVRRMPKSQRMSQHMPLTP